MKNLSSNYQTDSYPNQIYPVDIRKENLFLCLIPSKECNLDTFLKMIYSRKLDKLLTTYNKNNAFKSAYFKLDYERVRMLILNITPSDVATVLKHIRIQNGYSLEQLARLTGFSKSSISHRESIKSSAFPNLKTVQKYLNSCNITFFQFMFLIVMKVLIG